MHGNPGHWHPTRPLWLWPRARAHRVQQHLGGRFEWLAVADDVRGGTCALTAAATEIEPLLNGDADSYTSGQEELQEYLDANYAVAP